MESDDDYESFSFHNHEPSPSPSPKHRRLKRLKKSTVESVTELLDLPRVDFAGSEALESSDIRAFDDSSERPSERFDGDGDGDELRSGFDETLVDGDRKETKRSSQFDDDGDGKVKELSSCYDDTRVNSDPEETKEDLEFEESLNDDVAEENLSSGVGDTVVRIDRKETKRALDFDDDVNESGVDQRAGEEGERIDVEIREATTEKKGRKKRLKSSSDDAKAKTLYSSKRREEKDLQVESTSSLRAPVDDTQELFGDSQTSDSKESESCEQATSSQEEEEETGPSLLTMKLKFDSAPDDICDEEENDKENVDPHVQKHSLSKGDLVKAFVDDEAEEEDDSDDDRMVLGDDEEVEDEDEDDIEELNKMIATGYKERPIDLETRNELHQKWLEEKDAAGTDDLLRRLNVASKLREASLLDEEEGEEDVDVNDYDGDHEVVERPRVNRFKKAKEMIAQMFNDKDDDFFSSDDEETEKILARERMHTKDKKKGKLVSLIEDDDSREVFGLIKKLNTVPEGRKKGNATSFFDTMLTGRNSNSSSKSSFLSRTSNHSVPIPSKQGGPSGVRSFIFGRDDSNSQNSISISQDTSDTITSREMGTKKVTTKYRGSQSQGRSSTQTAKLDSESSSSSFFEILKQSSVQSNVDNQDHKIELSQSVFAAFKIPKKPIKIQGRV
ncbi:hypothetical protein L1987_64492 [Smallanthus sonchifolius]|uniref:Uncharacterized protein n=1 Tax=Smallanthus sonchifolius TaxID=185202 RepID=A0ACB9CGK1_9ASTR|nr:hypothetical protein L1987_64492 [Smallanthus sonchifolius]